MGASLFLTRWLYFPLQACLCFQVISRSSCLHLLITILLRLCSCWNHLLSLGFLFFSLFFFAHVYWFLLRYPLTTSHPHFLFLVSSHFPFQLNVFIIKSCYRISPLKLLISIAQCVTVYYACIDGGLEVMFSSQTQPFFLSQFVFKHSGAHSFLVWSMKWLIQPTSPSIQVTTLKHYWYRATSIFITLSW